MSDIGDRLRALFDGAATPIDPADIPRTVQQRPNVHRRSRVWSAWQVGVAAGVLALVLGGTALLLRMNGDGGIAEQTTSATQPSESGPAASSQDASIEWTQWALPDEFRVHRITAAGDLFFGMARDMIEQPEPLTRLWISEDGVNWEPVDVDASRFGMRAGYFRHLAGVGDGYVGIVKGIPLLEGDPDFRLVTSRDGRTWDPVDVGGIEALPMGIAGNDSGGIALVGTYEDGEYTYDVWWSTDALTWTQTLSDTWAGMGPHQAVEAIGPFFYVVSMVDGKAPGLLRSANAINWEPVDLPQPLGEGWGGRILPVSDREGAPILHTSGATDPQIWLGAADGSWREVTPVGFDATTAPGAGDPAASSINGGPIMIVDAGQSEERSGSDFSIPATIWWSLDGETWTGLSTSEAFGSEGTIPVATVNGRRMVVVHYPDSSGIGSLWIGDVIVASAPEISESDQSGPTVGLEDAEALSPVAARCSRQVEGFPCDALFDGSVETTWQAPGGGFNTVITLFFEDPVEISRVGFANATDDEQFRRNAHIRTVGIHADDPPIVQGRELADANGSMQWFDLDVSRTYSLTITVEAAYPGVSYENREPFSELALAEIVVLGHAVDEVPDVPNLILGSIETSPGQPIYPCSGDFSESPARPNRHGTVDEDSYATPLLAFEAFIARHAGELYIARFGYMELGQTDGSIIYGKPVDDSDLSPGYVTLVTVEPSNDGSWTATSWEGSGC